MKKEFTKAELATFDGQDGRPAYISFNKTVYDMGGLAHWKNGQHYRGAKAGIEVDQIIKKAPHGPEMLMYAKEIGKLID